MGISMDYLIGVARCDKLFKAGGKSVGCFEGQAVTCIGTCFEVVGRILAPPAPQPDKACC